MLALEYVSAKGSFPNYHRFLDDSTPFGIEASIVAAMSDILSCFSFSMEGSEM